MMGGSRRWMGGRRGGWAASAPDPTLRAGGLGTFLADVLADVAVEDDVFDAESYARECIHRSR